MIARRFRRHATLHTMELGAGDADTTNLHSNHPGTLREMTGASIPGLRVFTTFGESIPITPQDDRYGYVGAFGYNWTYNV